MMPPRMRQLRGGSFEGGCFEGGSFEGGSLEGCTFEGGSLEGGTLEGCSVPGNVRKLPNLLVPLDHPYGARATDAELSLKSTSAPHINESLLFGGGSGGQPQTHRYGASLVYVEADPVSAPLAAYGWSNGTGKFNNTLRCSLKLLGKKSSILGFKRPPPIAKPIGKAGGRSPPPFPMGFAVGWGRLDSPNRRFQAREPY
jgi:hypothetical protein